MLRGIRNIVIVLLTVMLPALGATRKVVQVASLHPLLSDMARRIGGNDVEVTDLFPENGELHTFRPSSEALVASARAEILIACGKGVEPYLHDLRQSLSGRTEVLAPGDALPDVIIPGTHTPDPHWWNTPENMTRAAQQLTDALCRRVEPAAAAAIRRRQADYRRAMEKLDRTARLCITRIPHARRLLVCSHSAMTHFCATYNIRPAAAQGAAAESLGDMAGIAALLHKMRSCGVRVVFAERKESPRYLQNIADSLQGEVLPLIPDGIDPELKSYEEIFLFNLRSICKGLATAADSVPDARP